MKIWATLFVLAISMSCFSQTYPEDSISNGLIKATIYSPEPQSGYYQGTRFDWAGVINSLEFNDHEYFGVWNPRSEYGLHDAITGPVDEYMVIGYDEVPVGENFIRVGVGALRKQEEESFSRFKTYEIADYGKRKSKVKKNKAVYSQKLSTESGYAYLYKKELVLEEGTSVLTLKYSLKNTGKKPIATSAYNHNFFMFDSEPTNQNIKTSFSFIPKADGHGFGSIAEIKGQSIIYNREVQNKETVFSADLMAEEKSATKYDLNIENTKTGAGVHISSAMPVEKMVYWACATTSCPEPYINISVAPGQTLQWSINYEFKSKKQ
ncbi:MAG: hypothetical protein NXI00_01840 [Cytophagales bacterium]|nr:hypothetical protein [Cytophagales bacterium]